MLPPVLSSIILKLLAKMAEERYQSAEGLRFDLERCRESLSRGLREDFVPGLHDHPPRFQLPQRLYGRDVHAAALRQSLERVTRNSSPWCASAASSSAASSPSSSRPSAAWPNSCSQARTIESDGPGLGAMATLKLPLIEESSRSGSSSLDGLEPVSSG